MSIKTTHYISRSTALEIWMERQNIMLPTNEELEEFLEEQEESHFRNYYIVDKLEQEQQADWCIRDKFDF